MLKIPQSKNFMPLITAVFILSVFVGVILSIVIKYWLIKNIEIIKNIQYSQENKRLEKLLDSHSLDRFGTAPRPKR